MKAATVIALACLAVCACDVRESLARYPQPAAESFRAATVRVSAHGSVESTPGAVVKPEFFRPYAIQPLIGRLLMTEDFTPAAPRLALFREDYWRERFAAAPDVIGTEVEIDGVRTTIIGVLPLMFDAPHDVKIWLNGSGS